MKHLVNTSNQNDMSYAVLAAVLSHPENANFNVDGRKYQIIQLKTVESMAHAISVQMDLARENPKADLFNILHLPKTEISSIERRFRGEAMSV